MNMSKVDSNGVPWHQSCENPNNCLKCQGYGCRCGGRCQNCKDHKAGLHKHNSLVKSFVKILGAGEMLHKFREKEVEMQKWLKESGIQDALKEAYKKYQYDYMNKILSKIQPGDSEKEIDVNFIKSDNSYENIIEKNLNEDILKKIKEYNIHWSKLKRYLEPATIIKWFLEIYIDEGFNLFFEKSDKERINVKKTSTFAHDLLQGQYINIIIQWSVPSYYGTDFSKVTDWNDLYKKLQLNVFYGKIGYPEDEINLSNSILQKKYTQLFDKHYNEFYNDYGYLDAKGDLFSFYKKELDQWLKDVCKMDRDGLVNGKLPKVKNLYPEYFLKLGKPKEIEELEMRRKS